MKFRGYFTPRLAAVVALLVTSVSTIAGAQVPQDSSRPSLHVPIGKDTLPPLQLPTVQTSAQAAAYKKVEAEIAAARAIAFQLNARSIARAVWGEIPATGFATQFQPLTLPVNPAPSRPRPVVDRLLSRYADIGVQMDGRMEVKGEKDESSLCRSTGFLVSDIGCHSAFEPLLDFQYAIRSGGVIADRLHVNVDYDSRREFDASNTIAISYDGKPHDFLQNVEVGNVTFQPPQSHFITAAIPSGNYGMQALMQFGGMQLRTIVAQQKGHVIRDRIFTVGERVLQAVDRTVEDYQFEPRRFFFTVDPKLLKSYPNVDILNRQQMLLLSRALPDSIRPVRLSLYRLRIGAQPPNPNGPQFRLLGDPQSRRGQVYEFLREGIDYYVDPSLLWICLLRPLSLNNERLVVAYSVRINGVETVHPSTGGTPDLQYDPTHDQLANLLWDPSVEPGDPAFDREIRSVYRVGGADVVRQSVAVKIRAGSVGDQEKPLSGAADTYLQLFGLAQSTNTSSFDVENRLWPRPTDPNQALGVGVFGEQIIRDQFLILPSLRPFAANGLATGANPHNDTIYTTPAEYIASSQRPQAIYHILLHYQAQGNGDNGTLLLGAVQVRSNSERILVDNVPLTRGTDYSVDYDLGRVNFSRPDTLFSRPRQVVVQFEENPLFTETPTSIAGALLQIPFARGQVNVTALSQSQQSTYTRPALGLEPQATLIGGVNASLDFSASKLASLVARLPAADTTVPSRITVSAEFAASKPQPGKGQQAYLESFEGGGGFAVPLVDQYWYYSSQPAAGQTLLPRVGTAALDLDRATTLAWQTNVLDANGRQIRYSIQQIDPLSTLVGTGIAPPEQLLWLTLYPLSIGGLSEPGGQYNWHTGNSLSGRRWRSVRTVLNPSGVDVSHTENIEFWALVHTGDLSRAKNPTLVFDVGDISENSVALSPDTAIIHLRQDGRRDTTFLGRQIEGLDRLDSERDPFSRAFNANVNDTGLPGDVADQLTLIADTLSGQTPLPRNVSHFRACRGGYRVLYPLGDARANCTVQNGRLDEEDIDGDNVLNYTTAQRNSEQWWRYVVDLSDNRRFNRVGRCILANTLDPAAPPGDSVCWVYFRVPFSTPDDSINSPLLRRAHALRLTMISGAGAADTEFTQIALDQLRLTGAPWLKRNASVLRGIAGDQTGNGFVIAGTVGTQDRQLRNDVDYQPPPGVTDQADLKLAPLGVAPVQTNEHSLRLTAGGLQLFQRAEAYYRFADGDKNFMSYKDMRLWARGIGNGWGVNGELQFFVKIGSGVSDFYMYRTPLGGAAGVAGWLPEIHVDFARLLALRSRIQAAYLRNLPHNTCTGSDSILIANTPLPAGVTDRYAACDDGYIVYSVNPGITPPNLAAAQELSVGILRTAVGTGPKPILATDTLELWVDDIRLGSAVNSAGFAGQAGVGIVAGDVADIRASVTRRDPNFRQLGDLPSYSTDNNIDVSAAFRLDKLLPKWLGYSIPLTVNYDASSSDPLYLSGSDISADGIYSLRTPKTAATSITFGVKRLTPLTGAWGPLLNNMELTGSYSAGAARNEYVDGHSNDFRVTLAYNLLRSLAPSLTSVVPTELYLTTTYDRGDDRRLAYLTPTGSPVSSASISTGLTNTLRNEGAFAIHPFPNANFRIDVASLRDLRGYGSDTLLGVIDASERDRIAGLDAGLERERNIGTQFNYAGTLLSWIRGRVNMTSSYTMLHDPNTLSFVRALDSIGTLQIPRQIGNTQTTSAGVTLDIPRLLGLPTSMFGATRTVLSAFQPIDVSIERNVLTNYEGTTVAPPVSYQLGLGGIGQFRHLGDESATSAGVNTQFTISNSIKLPLGVTLSNRYQRVTLRNWTQVVDDTNAIGDATQLIFPDIGIRWNVHVSSPDAMLSSFSASARLVGTRQLLSSASQSVFGVSDDGETRVRNYPLSMTAVWSGSRPLTTTFGVNFTKRVDNRPGLAGNGKTVDLTADVSRAFALPPNWHTRSDVRTRLSFEDSHGQSYVLNPLAIGMQSQLSNNGRRAATFTTDTDVAENLSSSLVISRVANFDNNLNRLFTQTVVSAVFHLQFFAGEIR